VRNWKSKDQEIVPISSPPFHQWWLGGILGMYPGLTQVNAVSRAPSKK